MTVIVVLYCKISFGNTKVHTLCDAFLFCVGAMSIYICPSDGLNAEPACVESVRPCNISEVEIPQNMHSPYLFIYLFIYLINYLIIYLLFIYFYLFIY